MFPSKLEVGGHMIIQFVTPWLKKKVIIMLLMRETTNNKKQIKIVNKREIIIKSLKIIMKRIIKISGDERSVILYYPR